MIMKLKGLNIFCSIHGFEEIKAIFSVAFAENRPSSIIFKKKSAAVLLRLKVILRG